MIHSFCDNDDDDDIDDDNDDDVTNILGSSPLISIIGNDDDK